MADAVAATAISPNAAISAPSSAASASTHPLTPKARELGRLVGPRKRRHSVEPPSPKTSIHRDPGISPTSSPTKAPFSPPTLTAAQAIVDQKKHKREKAELSARQQSPNPARSAITALLGNQMSSATESGDSFNAATSMSEPVAAVAPPVQIPGTPRAGAAAMQTSPASLSSFGTVEGTANLAMDSNGASVASPGHIDESTGHDDQVSPRSESHPKRQNTDTTDTRSNKALTFPGPLPNFPSADRRRNTHSGFGRESPSKSPSTKKHQCPYCSTTFTRHHNLKSHLLTHSHEKPYYCDTCDSRFRRLHDLKRHSKLHTGERPHTCPKCRRSFARGDALARHSKGAGGCAGRRSSLGGDEQDQDDSMHGLLYTGEASHEPERMDDETEGADSRKGSLPSIKRHDAPGYQDRQPSYSARQPSTYPPVASRQSNPGGLYPPIASPGGGSSTSNSPRQSSFNQPGSGSSTFPISNQNVFSQGVGMTESPKPLSPGSHQLGHTEPGIHRNRSPSLTQQFQQQQFGRRAASHNTTPPMGLPPMPQASHSNAPHLPSLSSLPPPDLRFTLHSQSAGPGHAHPTSQSGGPSTASPSYPTHSGNNSLSSQGTGAHGGNGESNHNLLGQNNDRLWAYLRSLETKVDRLQEEIGSLRGQLSTPR
ncbi:MAG: hypothetical protein Q9190_002551 [Brigantiaea leucoxantha]